jgi:hypothetical protein
MNPLSTLPEHVFQDPSAPLVGKCGVVIFPALMATLGASMHIFQCVFPFFIAYVYEFSPSLGGGASVSTRGVALAFQSFQRHVSIYYHLFIVIMFKNMILNVCIHHISVIHILAYASSNISHYRERSQLVIELKDLAYAEGPIVDPANRGGGGGSSSSGSGGGVTSIGSYGEEEVVQEVVIRPKSRRDGACTTTSTTTAATTTAAAAAERNDTRTVFLGDEIWNSIAGNRSSVFLHTAAVSESLFTARNGGSPNVILTQGLLESGDALYGTVPMIRFDRIPAHFRQRYLLSDVLPEGWITPDPLDGEFPIQHAPWLCAYI